MECHIQRLELAASIKSFPINNILMPKLMECVRMLGSLLPSIINNTIRSITGKDAAVATNE